ncbi:MAG: hypothetical protein ACTHLE_08610 [Agriterribacter sp.]
MKNTIKLIIAVCSIMYCITSCSKSYEYSSMQSIIDSLNKITTISVNNVTMGDFTTEGLSQAYALAPNAGYTRPAFSGGASSIDFVFNNTKFWATDPSGISNLVDTKARFGTTTLTAAAFADISSRDEIYSYDGESKEVEIAVGKVVFCKTKDGHRSLILIKSISNNGDTLRMDYKIDVIKN